MWAPGGARLWRYAGYVVAGLIGVVVLLAVGSWLAIRAWGPELARERVEAALTEALGRECRVERVDIQPWIGRVVIAGVTAASLPTEPGPHFLTLARVEANIGVSSLWRRRIVLRSVRLGDLDLSVSGGGAGATLRELPILPEVVRAGPVDVELGPIELRRGRLVYEDPARAMRAQAQGVSLTARPGPDATSVTIAADEIKVGIAGLEESVGKLEAEVRVAPTSVEIRRLAATWEKRPLTVAGRVDGPFHEPAVALTARATVDLAPLGRRLHSTWPLAGMVRTNARLEGPVAALRVAGSVAIDELTAGPVKARAVAARVAFAGGVVSVTQLSARAFNGSVRGEAVIEPARLDRARVSLDLKDVSSPALEELAGLETGVTARLDAHVDARGDLRDLARAHTRLRVNAREVRLPKAFAALGSGTVDAEASGERGEFDLSRGIASWPGLGLETRGRVTLAGAAPLRVKATGELARLAPLLGTVRVAGDAVLEGEVTGRWRDPALAGRLDVRSPAVNDVRADAVTASFVLMPRSLRLTEGSVRIGQARLAASGHLAWPASAPPAVPAPDAVSLDMLARTENVHLEDAALWLPPALRGSAGPVGVTVKVDGTLAAWHVAGRVESPRLSVPSAPPLRDVAASFDATAERIEVSALQARALDAAITAKGRWRWAGSGEVEADAGLVDLARVPGVPEGLRVEGRARGNVSVSVRDGRVAGSARILAESVKVAGFALGRGTAGFSLDNVQLPSMGDGAVRAQVAFPEARIAATGQGRLDRAAVITTRVTVTDLEIAPLLRQYRPDLADALTGQFSVDATLDVPAREPRAARGVIRLEPVRFEAKGERWEARGPIVVRREPGRSTLERLEVAGRLGTATATGWLDDSGALEGTVRGQVPLTLLSTFRPEIREASGRLDMDVRVGGTTAKPILVGRGTIAGGLIAVRDTPLVIRDIAGSILLSPARLRVEELRASVGAGTVRATGEIGLDGGAIGAYQVALTGRGLSVTPLDGLETAWNADATLVGRGARGIVRGDAHLLRGSYTRDLSILPMLMSGGSREQPIEWGREIALQVALHLDDNVVVRSPQARVRAGGNLLLQGTVARPFVLGTVETQDGRITFRRNPFTLENAVIRFDDPGRLNPYLDVRATTRIRTHEVTMWLSGRVDDLTIRLSSEPPLPQEDLLALVTLGATRAELGTSGGLTFAGEAAQLISKELLGIDASTSFIDVLEFGRSESGQSEFRVGKRIDERTTVIYSGSFAEGGKQKLRIEYQVIGPLLLAGEQVFSGGFGGDVILRLRFR